MAAAWVQSLGTPVANNGNSSTIPFTTNAAVTAGNFIVLKLVWISTSKTLSSVAGGGLTWTIDKQQNFAGNGAASNVAFVSAQAPSGLASGTTITATLSGLATHEGAAADEYSGIATSAPTDGSSGQNSNLTATPAAPSFTTTTNGDLVIGGFCGATARTALDTMNPGTGFTTRQAFSDNAGFQGYFEEQIQSTAGAIAPGMTDATGTAGFGSIAVAYKAAGAPSPPTNTVAPAVTGTAALGSVLTTSDGTWTGTPTSFAYQWQRSSDSGATWVSIPDFTSQGGAITNTHTVVGFDVGSLLRCVVTATNANGNASANSNATTEIAPVSGAPSYRLVSLPAADSDNQTHTVTLTGAVLPNETMVLMASTSSIGTINGDMGSVTDPNGNAWTLDHDTGLASGNVTQAFSAQNGASKLNIGATITNKIKQTTVVGANALNSATINVVSTSGFVNAAGTLNIGAGPSGVAFTFTGTTPTSFTGCGSHAALTGGEFIGYHGQSPYYAVYALNPGDGSTSRLAFDAAAAQHAVTATPSAGPITTTKSKGVAFTLGVLGNPDTNNWMTPGSGWTVDYAGFHAVHASTPDTFGISYAGESGYKTGVQARTYSASGTSITGNFTSDASVGGWQDAMVVAYGFTPAAGPPANTVAPVVTGTTIQGFTLSTTDGTWTNTPTGFTYQWQRDVAGNGVFSNISLATASTYTLVAGDVGNNVRCVVTATNATGSTSANSNTVGPISAPFTPSGSKPKGPSALAILFLMRNGRGP